MNYRYSAGCVNGLMPVSNCMLSLENIELNRKLNSLVPTTVTVTEYIDCVGSTIYLLPLNPYNYITNTGLVTINVENVSDLTALPVEFRFIWGCNKISFVVRQDDGSVMTNDDLDEGDDTEYVLSVCGCANILTEYDD